LGEPNQGSHEAAWWLRERILPGLAALVIFGILLSLLLWATPLAHGQEPNCSPIVESVEDTNETTELWVDSTVWLSEPESRGMTRVSTFEWISNTFHLNVEHLDLIGKFRFIVFHKRLEKPLSVDCTYETSRTVIVVGRE
jgi:hypothetical protein